MISAPVTTGQLKMQSLGQKKTFLDRVNASEFE